VANDEERQFRLRPRKPAARTERIALASAYKTIMHYAPMTSRTRRASGLGYGRKRPHFQRCAVRVTDTENSTRGQWRATGVTSPEKARRTRVIRGQSGSMPLKKRSTSQRGSRISEPAGTHGPWAAASGPWKERPVPQSQWIPVQQSGKKRMLPIGGLPPPAVRITH
jgi:hypothetical protein